MEPYTCTQELAFLGLWLHLCLLWLHAQQLCILLCWFSLVHTFLGLSGRKSVAIQAPHLVQLDLIASTPSYVFAVYWVILPSLTTNNWCTVSVSCGTLKQDCWEATSQSVGTDTYLPTRRGQYSHDYPAACYRRMEDGGWSRLHEKWCEEIDWDDDAEVRRLHD